MRLPTDPTFRSVDYDNLERDGDVCRIVQVVYGALTVPQGMKLHTGRDYRVRERAYGDGTPTVDEWVLESRPGGMREQPWTYEGMLVGRPPSVDVASEYFIEAHGTVTDPCWEIRPGFTAKPSGTCDP